MKKLFLISFLTLAVNMLSAQNYNMQFRSQLTYSDDLSNICGIAVNAHEYALVGWWNGVSIVDVTNPDSIYEVFNVPGAASEWREIKTWNNYAYITTESNGDGLIIANLNYLPDSVPYHEYHGDAAIVNQLNTIHALHIDAGYVYLYGSNLFQGTAVICDLNADPWNPHYVGNTEGADPKYIHDGYVRNDTLYACHIYSPGYFSIMDVSNKANPIELNTQATPDAFTHNSWLNDAGSVIFTTDEVPNSYLASYNVTDPYNIVFLDKYQVNPGSQAIVHNTHTLNDYEIVSWYTEGVVIVDASHPDNLIEVGHYDTSPFSGSGFHGAWGVYPFLPSGNLVVSDIEQGLFVLTPTYQRGCYLEGTVTDSIIGTLLSNAKVEILSTSKIKFSNINGIYKTGIFTAGLYDIKVSKAGFADKIITGVSLSNGVTTTLDVQLVALQVLSITGQVLDATNNNPVPNAFVHMQGNNGTFDVATDVSGNFIMNNFYPGSYDVVAGKWLYITNCSTQNVSGNVTIYLTPGIYDDFSFDFGWNVSSTAPTGDWVRGEPVGTINGNSQANPDFDVTNDCLDQAFITGNGGGSAGNDDVDNGFTILSSPVIDLSTYLDPVLYYSRWFYNATGSGGSSPNDTLYIKVSNGTVSVNVEFVNYLTPGISTWVDKNFHLNTLIPITNTMNISAYISDQASSGNVCEGGFDHFSITEGPNPNAVEEIVDHVKVSVYPNPFGDECSVNYKIEKLQNTYFELCDVAGRTIKIFQPVAAEGIFTLGNEIQSGIYFMNVRAGSEILKSIKIVKTK